MKLFVTFFIWKVDFGKLDGARGHQACWFEFWHVVAVLKFGPRAPGCARARAARQRETLVRRAWTSMGGRRPWAIDIVSLRRIVQNDQKKRGEVFASP